MLSATDKVAMDLITVKELSEKISTKKSTIYAWVEQGKLPCYKLHGLLRFDPAEIEEWVKRSKLVAVKPGKLTPPSSHRLGIDKIVKRAIDEATGSEV